MKIWRGFSSEHSTNLVMIGRFQDAKEAKQVKQIIDQLTQQAMDEADLPSYDAEPRNIRYSNPMLDLLSSVRVNTVGPTELEQLLYEVKHEVKDSSIIITTDEIDVSAFMKILIEKGARVEVYSAHDYPGTEHARGG